MKVEVVKKRKIEKLHNTRDWEMEMALKSKNSKKCT